MYRVIGFDVDGVLRRSRREIWRCVLSVLAHFQIPRAQWPGYDQFWCQYSEPYLAMWRQYEVIASETEIVTEYTKVGGRSLQSPLYHDAPLVVRRLERRGVLLLAVSASPEENVRECLDRAEIEDCFYKIVGRAYDKMPVLRTLRERIALTAGVTSFAYVGDIASDMKAAKEAGWDGIAHAANHCNKCVLNDSPFTHRITRLRQLLSLSPPP